ncbi:hypothetical protein AMAG_01949 [Allomyces macrogynus ATCC 38327]|uniref:PSP1 C-terminal domain-containing protein n=1 Tax=Allomyces macrogynus (strain ATCC 38327) TaxID=578462 RepID=A0A0L0S176_ALLM3|nr:hypothetical protein AMAG_01949 [Allomyces macrogynus ATCC 38327]|eukprot:KNE56109.1 hypothetical protein AMAG_01949 [Allomyces macrogynus ATCC 38327]
MMHEADEYFDPPGMHSAPGSRRGSLANLASATGGNVSPSAGSGNGSQYADVGRGVPLHALPPTTNLYIVEFKSGRSDIFYVADSTGIALHKGDLVIVEADRGKDLGKVINTAITPHQIQVLQTQQSEVLTELHRVNREIHPKRIYRLAQPQEVAMLVSKSQDEAKAMAVCATKVRQKKLPMEVVDAEYQWDRRKLTFYFVADRRIDFRELVRDLFKIYKTRIWMCSVSAITKAPTMPPAMPKTPPSLSPNSAGVPTSAAASLHVAMTAAAAAAAAATAAGGLYTGAGVPRISPHLGPMRNQTSPSPGPGGMLPGAAMIPPAASASVSASASPSSGSSSGHHHHHQQQQSQYQYGMALGLHPGGAMSTSSPELAATGGNGGSAFGMV